MSGCGQVYPSPHPAVIIEMIETQSLTYTYAQHTPIFQDFNWKVEKGEAWAVLGPSGCGKTTLLYLLAGLRFPTSGAVLVDGQRLQRPRPQTGLILQEYGLLPWATVRQNVELGMRIRDFYGPDGKHAPSHAQEPVEIDVWLQRLGLADHQDKYPSQISGGQRQRTAIARTLALHPDLLLMDEPFSSLDAPTREGLQNLTLELRAEAGLTLVIVTHAIEEAAVMGQKILLLGMPPNTEPVVIDNPHAGKPGYRNEPEYQALCRQLRERMAAAV
jgi:ABC-type nitrate/sulfonate/bicarbonate transport system ATPase subunit